MGRLRDDRSAQASRRRVYQEEKTGDGGGSVPGQATESGSSREDSKQAMQTPSGTS